MNKARKLFFLLAVTAAAALLSGCGMKLVNQTPRQISQNPSNTYTLTLQVDTHHTNVVDESIQAYVVTGGQRIPMQRTAPESNLFAADVELPMDQARAVYYFEVNYQHKTVAGISDKVRRTDLFQFSLVNRYIVQLESDRAPVGATIPILGRGFSPADTIQVGNQVADTQYVSENLLRFTVPPLEAGRSYPVIWQSGLGNQEIGNFRVDGASLIVRPNRLVLETGQRAVLVFQIDYPAPRGGLIINDTTDIPRSVIMPEVVIPEGARSVSVPLEAGAPGQGNLYFSIAGTSEVVVPLTVTSF